VERGEKLAHGVENDMTPAATAQIVSRLTGVYRSSVSDRFLVLGKSLL
jgi:hypothetical protein